MHIFINEAEFMKTGSKLDGEIWKFWNLPVTLKPRKIHVLEDAFSRTSHIFQPGKKFLIPFN